MEAEKKSKENVLSKNQRKRDKRNRSKKQAKAKVVQKEGASKPKNTLLPDPARRIYHSNLPQVPVKKVTEPLDTCIICGQVIDVIASAMTHPQGGFCHFDCVLEKLKAEEQLSDSQKISYIGRGTFAVVQQNEDGTFTFVKRIVWENAEALEKMKKYVETVKQ
ncbi:MAG: hypothetical protein AB7C91_02005 [Sphaerochaeta sp.]|uniref:hypothetical protein n=1 Tax=Sphaerochaeta sp. TaxID=1972642 RepID=UPI002FCA76EA